MLPKISHRLSTVLPMLSTKFAMPGISFGEVREGAPIINQKCNTICITTFSYARLA
jgi:hypothetical protein